MTRFRSFCRRMRCLAALLCLSTSLAGCGAPPKMTSEEAAKAVDALYTAVTARRTDLVQKVEAQCATLRSEGKLSEDELAELTDIIAQAKNGEWDEAAGELDVLIRSRNQ